MLGDLRMPAARVVEEPGYSSRRLRKYERKYGMSTDVFAYLYRLGKADVPADDARDWLWHYEINLQARILLQTGLHVLVSLP